MYDIDIQFLSKIRSGVIPTPYVMITTDFGTRVYAKKELNEMFTFGTNIADGSVIADGSELAGGELVISLDGRILKFGNITNTVQSDKFDALSATKVKQQGYIALEFDNVDRYFSQILPHEPFLTKNIKGYFGIPGDARSTHKQLFDYYITKQKLTPTKYIITATEQ